MVQPKPATMCMAPWVHTYLSPQTERRMCCASREPAQNFEQYIDTSAGTGKYIPITLDDHWNSTHMRDVRKRMMSGETLPECEVCNDKLLNTDVYRTYFWHLFNQHYNSIWEKTDETGYTTMKPISWDYRFSNLCNFKCRTCGDMLSSSWEVEEKQFNTVDWNDPKNNWMQPDTRKQITIFQDLQVEKEFSQAVLEHRVEEIYWAGGEPLMFEQHWRYMKQIVDQGDGGRVYARYNTNLSRINYRGVNLYTDILANLRDWQICASLDGTGAVGEYIRTGLDYEKWLQNFRQGLAVQRHRRQMRIDFTLTLPGLFEVENIQQLALELDVDVLAKVIFSFSPIIVMSPLCLPRALLDAKLDSLLNKVNVGALRDVLLQLKQRPTFEQQWPDTWWAEVIKGKRRMLEMERVRNDTYTLDTILQQDKDIHEFWQSIPC